MLSRLLFFRAVKGVSGVYTIDAIRDVISVACIRWVCETLVSDRTFVLYG